MKEKAGLFSRRLRFREHKNKLIGDGGTVYTWSRLRKNSEMIKSILLEISSVITDLDEGALLKKICEVIRNYLQLTFVGLFIINLDKELIFFRAGSGKVGQRLMEKGYSLPIDGNSSIAKSIRFNEVWINKLTGEIFKCPLPKKDKLKTISTLELQYETTETWVATPLIPALWQISLPLRTNSRRFGGLLVFHEDDTFEVSIEDSTAYLQKLVDEIAEILNDLGVI